MSRSKVLALAAAAALSACGGDGPKPGPPAGHVRMVATLAALAKGAAQDHPYFGSARLDRLRHEVERAGDAAGWRLLLEAATEMLHHGEERPAIALLERAHDGIAAGRMPGDAAARVGVAFHLGTAYFRLGETENCCANPTDETCILPIRGTGVHSRTEGAEHAARCFAEVLDLTPPDDYWHHAARWLLNLAHMTLGTWPDGVPVAHRLPARAFTDDSGMPRFRQIAAAVGLDTEGTAGGVVVEDFDGDEYLDVCVSEWAPASPLRLYRNARDGTFVDVTERAGLTGITGGLDLVGADYDGDGDIDVLVLRGGWCHEHGRWPCSLLQNRGDGTFTDVTFAAGLGERREPTQTAAFADYDLDGDLDLYVGAENSKQVPCSGHLYRNEGDGTFTDVATAAGVADCGYCKGAVFGDYDGDRYPDLFLSNRGGPNHLYHNQGDGTFRDVAAAAGVAAPKDSFATWFWDFDNDGNLDLFVANYLTGVAHIDSYLTGGSLPYERARFYRGDGAGHFRDVGHELGFDYPAEPMGCNFGDLDNDGWLDCYLGTGDPEYWSLMPNLMLQNVGGVALRDVTMSGGFGHLQKGHGVAFADLDEDGDQDVFAVMGGAYPGDAFGNVLFENPGFGHHWLTVRLVGRHSVACGLGARLCAVVREGGRERRIYRHVTTGGSFGGNPLRQTIGLGDADELVRLEVLWPGRGPVQVLRGVPLDRAIRVVEGDSAFTVLDLPPLNFRHG